MRWGTYPALALALALALSAVAAEYAAGARMHDELAWHRHAFVRDAAHPWRPQQPYIPNAGVSAEPEAVPPRAAPPKAPVTASAPATRRSLVWAVLQGALALIGWGIGIVTYLVLLVPKALLDTAHLAYAFTLNLVTLITRYPIDLSCSVAYTVYVYVYELCAPLRYVGFALYLAFVAWPIAALSSVMYVTYQFYVIAGVAVLLGVMLGLLGGAFLALENRFATKGYQLPWVEKYRPRRLEDVVGNAQTIERLRVIEENGNCPHLLVSGLPGIGKTTSVHCLARALLGDAYKEAVLELNASDDRGIDVVRNKIKVFAQKKVSLPPGRHKIIILDEADSMTPGAQQALRRTMEIYANTTRFCFACNQSNKIIEPIQSRCAILRFGRVSDEELLRRLVEICKAEHVEYADEGLAAIVFTAEGDMRQAINNLQSTWTGQGFVSADNVFKVCDQPHPMLLHELLAACHRGEVDAALDKLDEVWTLGYSALDIVTTLFRVVKTMDELPEPVKLEYIREIGWTHMRVLEGVGSLLQLSGLVARLSKQAMDPQRFVIA
ncbi:replication factor C subunit 4 [Malassezia brasiliensis]|uniref:Replication factor C subunit 4 n=1 Tax=Malassezia brasiliensis TaxID=1821822 RepID=A0AAF0DQP1_9BASI|nr:replication factor C subunit 4 [Malassezia brasiliensis]